MKHTHPVIFQQTTRPLFKFGAMLLFVAALVWNSPAFATLANYQAAVTNTPGIISYYTFDQMNANDIVGTNNGTAVNPIYAPGVDGDGLGFLCYGTNQVNLGAVSDFEFASGAGSVEAWVRADWSGIFSAYSPTLWANGTGYPTDWSIHMEGDKTEIGMWNGSLYYPTISVPFANTNWHHLVTIFDNGTFTVFWDGQFAGTQFRVLGANPNTTQLGSSASYGGEGWIGMFDEVAFYSVALDTNTIQAHYQAFFAGTPPVIVTPPVGGTFLPGVTLTLNVSATGPDLSYQWFQGTDSLTGQTNATLTLPNLAAGDAGSYHVVVSNPSGAVPTEDVTVSLGTLPPQVVHYQVAVSNEASLISYYTFDWLTANDAFGMNNGTLQGSAVFASGVAGGAGQGVLLDGGGQVNLGATPSFAFSAGSGSVEAWVRADWVGDFTAYSPTLFANEDFNNSVFQWSVQMTGDKNFLFIYNGSGTAVYAIPNGGAGTNWHHIAAVFDQATNTLYWDGAAIGTIYLPLGGSPTTTQLGSSSPESTTEGWMGLLDEVAFYSGALTASSVQAHYNAFYLGITPVISVQPTGGNFLVGSVFSMSAQAQGAPLACQWYMNNVPIPGATNLTLGFASLALTNIGVYYVTASNSFGVAQSVDAVVQVGNDIARYQATVRGESSLISYYTFDAGNANDTYGTNNGTPEDTVSFAGGPGGVTNQALLLAGAGRIDLGQVAAFDFITGGTAEAWIQPDWNPASPPSYDPCVFADRNGCSVWSVHMAPAENAIGNWNNDRFITLPFVFTGGWHHFAITFGAGVVSMYWDGQPLGSFAQAINFCSGQTSQIGGSQPGTTQEAWFGGIDEVAFYGSALSPQDINNHFLAMVGPATSPALSYSVSGNHVLLSWPSTAIGFTLESTSTLSTPSWNPVGGVVANSVSVTISSGDQFFRLKK